MTCFSMCEHTVCSHKLKTPENLFEGVVLIPAMYMYCCSLCAVGVICAAPALDGAWWRAQVITFYKENNEVEIRYVDYGGYDRVKIDTLRQIR